MINPNKVYGSKKFGKIVKIDSLNAYIPYVYVERDGVIYSGDLYGAYSNPTKLKVGQEVYLGLQWSIVADKPMIANLKIKRK